MKYPAHTPGPWRCRTNQKMKFWISCPKTEKIQDAICVIPHVFFANQSLARARLANCQLLAMAPELLACLSTAAIAMKAITQGKRDGGTMGDISNVYDMVMGVLKKAGVE